MKSAGYRKFTEINLIFAFSLALFGAILAPYIKSRGFSEWQISLMFTIFPLVNILFLPIFGKIADMLNRRIVILFGIVLEILALVFYLIDFHWSFIVAGRFFDAIAASLVALIVLAKIEDSILSKSRGKKTGNSLSLAYIGQLIGPVVGAFLADYFFIELPFVVAGVILFILSGYLLVGGFGSIQNIKIKLSDLSWLDEIKLFLAHSRLKGMGIMGMVMHATNPAMKVFLPILIVSYMGLSYSSIGIAFFVYGLTHMLQGVFGKYGDRFGHWKFVLFGTGIVAITLIGISFISSYWILLIFMFIQGVGSSMWNVSAWSLMSNIGEKEKIEAQILTSYFSIAKVGSLFSFLLSAWLVKIFGLQMIFMINGIIILIGITFAFRYLKVTNS